MEVSFDSPLYIQVAILESKFWPLADTAEVSYPTEEQILLQKAHFFEWIVQFFQSGDKTLQQTFHCNSFIF